MTQEARLAQTRSLAVANFLKALVGKTGSEVRCPTRAAIRPINHEEIIEEIERHIRKFRGEHNEWCVGTAKDGRAPFFRRHLAADLGDGLIYREAFTTSAADAVIDHLVNHCGLRPDRNSVPDPGTIVFVYRRTDVDHVAASSPRHGDVKSPLQAAPAPAVSEPTQPAVLKVAA